MRGQGLLLLIIILSSYETGLDSACKDIQATGYKFEIERVEVGKEEEEVSERFSQRMNSLNIERE